MALSIPLFAIWASAMKERYKAQQGLLSETERDQLTRLSAAADNMCERIETLEAILDAEVPDWRDDHERNR